MMLRRDPWTRQRNAFTLLEILIVVAIIVVVAGIGGYYLFGALEKGKEDTAKAQMKVLENVINTYRLNNGGNPPQNLQILLAADPNNANLPYLKDPKAIIDPWGRQYQYEYNDTLDPTLWVQTPNGNTLSNRSGAQQQNQFGP